MTTEQAFRDVGAVYFGDNFRDWFFPMKFKAKAECKTLTSQKLPHAMNDNEIMKELNPGEVSIEEIVDTLKTLDKSIWALFYCKDNDGVLRAVSVHWFSRGDGWRVNADSVLDPREWSDDYRVFSRNSRNTGTLGTSDTLNLGNFDARITALEQKWERLEKAIQT